MNRKINPTYNKGCGIKSWIKENWHLVDEVISKELTKEFNNSLSPDSDRYVCLLTESISNGVKDRIIRIVNAYEVEE